MEVAQVSTDRWMDKYVVYVCVCARMRTHTHTHTHTQEYYSAIKKNEILSFTMTYMELQSTMLSETSQERQIPFFKIIELAWI